MNRKVHLNYMAPIPSSLVRSQLIACWPAVCRNVAFALFNFIIWVGMLIPICRKERVILLKMLTRLPPH